MVIESLSRPFRGWIVGGFVTQGGALGWDISPFQGSIRGTLLGKLLKSTGGKTSGSFRGV
jgi:hypothetical protein